MVARTGSGYTTDSEGFRMPSKTRSLAGALILCLIVVPALVRATRSFDPGPRPRLAPSFNKSFDVPPDVADVPADVAVALVLVSARSADVSPESIPAPPAPLRLDTLRGPPVRFCA